MCLLSLKITYQLNMSKTASLDTFSIPFKQSPYQCKDDVYLSINLNPRRILEAPARVTVVMCACLLPC